MLTRPKCTKDSTYQLFMAGLFKKMCLFQCKWQVKSSVKHTRSRLQTENSFNEPLYSARISFQLKLRPSAHCNAIISNYQHRVCKNKERKFESLLASKIHIYQFLQLFIYFFSWIFSYKLAGTIHFIQLYITYLS